jgi:hypothetical protein
MIMITVTAFSVCNIIKYIYNKTSSIVLVSPLISSNDCVIMDVPGLIAVVVLVCIQYLSPLKLWIPIPLRWCVLGATLWDKVCQWLVTGRWFSTKHNAKQSQIEKNVVWYEIYIYIYIYMIMITVTAFFLHVSVCNIIIIKLN